MKIAVDTRHRINQMTYYPFPVPGVGTSTSRSPTAGRPELESKRPGPSVYSMGQGARPVDVLRTASRRSPGPNMKSSVSHSRMWMTGQGIHRL